MPKHARIVLDPDHLNKLSAASRSRLEPLQGDRKGFDSIRNNARWKLVFQWQSGNASDVKIVN
jgi:proteic killer suppression protein